MTQLVTHHSTEALYLKVNKKKKIINTISFMKNFNQLSARVFALQCEFIYSFNAFSWDVFSSHESWRGHQGTCRQWWKVKK